MYRPKEFTVTDEKEMDAFIDAYSFATLISTSDQGIEATHIPIDRLEEGRLFLHLSRHNPIIHTKNEVCAIFTGPHAYISPRFFKSDFNVPTWNYSAVHCYGVLEEVKDKEEVWRLFTLQVQKYEGEEGWKLPFEEKYLKLTEYLAFFELKVTRREAKFKFSQNKSIEDQDTVIKALHQKGETKTAEFMKKIR